MSSCVEKLPHSCGSSDALQVFQDHDGKFTGFCFACSEYVEDPYGDKPEGYVPEVKVKSPEEIQAEIDEVSSLKAVTLHDRMLNKETLEHFGVKVGLSEQDGSTPALHFYPYTKSGQLIGYKVRVVENKKMWSIGTVKGSDFFGWEQAVASGSPRLYITEGELDAMTVWQVIREKQAGTEYEDREPAVVSLSSGSSSARKQLSELDAQIRQHFREVVLVFDNDEAGKAATAEGLNAFPGARTVTLPAKDPNDALVGGRKKALVNALLFKVEDAKNTSTELLDDLVEKALEPVELGLPFPWDGLNELTRGLRFGETYYFGAGVKMGKSDLANAIVAHFAEQHDLKVYLANLEETNIKATRKVLGKVAGKVFHDPNIAFDPDDMREAATRIKGKIHFVKAFQHAGWSSLKEDIYKAVNVHGVKLVLIDPITNLTNGIAHSEADTILRGVAQDLAAMAKDLDICVMIFCHCKTPDVGPPHERGGKILSSQFTGSRAMARSCNYMMGLEGNKDPDLPKEQQNLRRLVMLEDREFGTSGTVNFYWDANTTLFNEIKE